MTYAHLLGMGREELLAKLSLKVSPKRLSHMIGVEETAKQLAVQYGCDISKAGLAGLLHDYAKAESDERFYQVIDQYNLPQELKNWGNNIWHGVVGRYIIQEELGLEDDELLRAIEIHTVGAAEMTLLDKIVYIADYIEPSRDFPGVDEARRLAVVSLDEAVAYATARTIAYLATKGLPIYPQTLETYNAFVSYLT